MATAWHISPIADNRKIHKELGVSEDSLDMPVNSVPIRGYDFLCYVTLTSDNLKTFKRICRHEYRHLLRNITLRKRRSPVMNISKTSSDKQTLWLSETGQAMGLQLCHFDPLHLQQHNLVVSTATGRGVVYFFKTSQSNNKVLVLRHYKRGGLIAKVSDDKFYFTDEDQSRAFQELNILEYLSTQNVNVPKVMGARICKHGLFYTADIVTAAIPNCNELHEKLQNNPVGNEIWHAVGVQIGKMHKARVCHDDINVKNVLIDDQQRVFLLDFDKCSKKSGHQWQASNLQRFRRSIDKQIGLNSTYYFEEKNWQALLNGYQISA